MAGKLLGGGVRNGAARKSVTGALRNEILMLLDRLADEEMREALPTLGEIQAVKSSVLPYCFIGDVALRAGQDVRDVQLDDAAQQWESAEELSN